MSESKTLLWMQAHDALGLCTPADWIEVVAYDCGYDKGEAKHIMNMYDAMRSFVLAQIRDAKGDELARYWAAIQIGVEK